MSWGPDLWTLFHPFPLLGLLSFSIWNASKCQTLRCWCFRIRYWGLGGEMERVHFKHSITNWDTQISLPGGQSTVGFCILVGNIRSVQIRRSCECGHINLICTWDLTNIISAAIFLIWLSRSNNSYEKYAKWCWLVKCEIKNKLAKVRGFSCLDFHFQRGPNYHFVLHTAPPTGTGLHLHR